MERYRHDAYGAATVLDGDGSDDSDGVSDVENPYAFTARRLDLESDLMYYRNRQYSVTVGRFVSGDPARYADGVNVYQYVKGRPSFSRDPLGLAACKSRGCRLIWANIQWRLHAVGVESVGLGMAIHGVAVCVFAGEGAFRWQCCCDGRPFQAWTNNSVARKKKLIGWKNFRPDSSITIPGPFTGCTNLNIGAGAQEHDVGVIEAECKNNNMPAKGATKGIMMGNPLDCDP
ncbi:MAG: RHS repeat-associated core domain-containing protein [Candidatus Brocadiia bacterium]